MASLLGPQGVFLRMMGGKDNTSGKEKGGDNLSSPPNSREHIVSMSRMLAIADGANSQ